MELAAQVVINGILVGGLYALIAMGVSLLFGVMKIVNFAHGEFLMLGAYTSYWIWALAGTDPLVSMPLAVLTIGVLGYLIQRVMVQPIMDAPMMNQLLLTFGISLVLQNLALMLWTADSRSVVTAYTAKSVSIFGVDLGVARVLGFALAIVLTAVLMRWLHYSETGKATRAVAQNPQAAALMGIDVNQIYALTFALSAAVGAAAGVVTIIVLSADPFVGTSNLVRAFAIAILGGLGNLNGAILAGLLIGITESTMSAYLPNGGAWAEAMFFITIIGVLALLPQGLLGARRGAK